MKVMFLTNLPSPYRVDFFSELGKKCDLTVVYESATAPDRDNRWIKKSQKLKYKEKYLNGIKIGRGEGAIISFGTISIIKKGSFDAIVISGYSSLISMLTILYLYLKNIKFILSVDGGILRSESRVKYKVKKFFISKAMLYLSTGKSTSEFLMHYGVEKEKIRIYPFTSVRNKDIVRNSPIKSHYKKKLEMMEQKIILSVGQFIYRKGYDVLIKACLKLDKSTGVYIVGGTATNEYNHLKKELKLDNVHFVDFKSKEELKDYYLAADLFVLPTREDIWGLVINEAMASGLPIITTNKCVAGLELVKDNENGFIVPVDDEKTLAENINMILDDKKRCEDMGRNSLKKIKEYTIENMAKTHIKILEDILGEQNV